MPEFQIGDRVRCIRQHQWGDLGWEGEVTALVGHTPHVRWDNGVSFYITPGDLERVNPEDEPEQEAEWLTLTSWIIFYVPEHAIADGHVEDEVSSFSCNSQAVAEEEIGWFARNQYKVLATKKLTTRVPHP